MNKISEYIFGKPPELGHVKENFKPYLSTYATYRNNSFMLCIYLSFFTNKKEHVKVHVTEPPNIIESEEIELLDKKTI